MISLRVEDVGNDWLPTRTSLEVAAGECVVISGPSGVGKSLLLRAIADLDVHQGKVCLGDKRYTAMLGKLIILNRQIEELISNNKKGRSHHSLEQYVEAK